MQFPKNAKIEAVCDKNENQYRYALNNPHLDLSDPDNAQLVATDGKMLVALPVLTTEGDVAGMVPAAALAESRKNAGRSWTHARMLLNGVAEVPGGASYSRDERLSFPRWQDAIPAPTRREDTIAIDVDQLARIVKAAGGEGRVTLHIARKAKALDWQQGIRVEVWGSSATCVLMPINPAATPHAEPRTSVSAKAASASNT